MSDTFAVSVQGIDQELTRATGEYDSFELGPKTAVQIAVLLERLKALQCPEPKSDRDDLCPPALFVTVGEEPLGFVMNGGTLASLDTGGELTVEEAVSMLTDSSARTALGQRAREEAAPPAALKADVPVTDTDHITAASIDTSPSAPQFSLEVWKSKNAWGWTLLPPAVGAFFLFVGLIALKEDTGPAMVCLILGIALMFVRGLIKGWARETLRMGFDWKTNTLWAVRGRKPARFLPNANRFSSFSLEKGSVTESMRYETVREGVYRNRQVESTIYRLVGQTTDPQARMREIETFVKRKEGEAALRQLQQLHASQR